VPPVPSKTDVLAERLRRQRLTEPLKSRSGYTELFRALQPVATIHDARPGDPPRLVHRTAFDDGREADRLRRRRELVKGRFLRGSIGYVLADDLALYANAFARPLAKPNPRQRGVLEAVQASGPLTPRLLKEETGLLNKEIMPALHRLQQAFLVYEDQVDREWDRAWFDFASEWPDVRLDEALREEARAEVLGRMLRAHVFATREQVSDWSGLGERILAAPLARLEEQGAIRGASVEGLGEGWLSCEPVPRARGVPRSVFVLHRADPLGRSHQSEIAARFAGLEVLRTLLIDGEFVGAITGHWGFGDFPIDDIVLELPAREIRRRRTEILHVVRDAYAGDRHEIVRYGGKELD
jgi:hypothetical protein